MNEHYKIGLMTFASTIALNAGWPADAKAGASPDVTMTVTASPAPNFYGSPSYSAWNANAISALEQGLSTFGTPNTPSYYYQTTTGTDASNIVSNFPSWNGVADPASPFSSELGNRLTFNLVAQATGGAMISLSELSATVSSTDPGNTFGFAASWTNPTTNAYNQYQIGLIFNGGHTTVVDSGSNSQLVDELIVVGLGNALAATIGGGGSNPTCSAAGTQQQILNCVKGQYDSLIPFSITADYTLNAEVDPSASATVLFGSPATVPEPSSLTLFGSALAGLGLIGLRRRRGQS